MRKKDFVKSLSKDLGLSIHDCRLMVNAVFAEIRKQLLEGKEVNLQRIGRFDFKYKPAEDKYNSLLGEMRRVDSRVRMRFRIHADLQKELNEGLAKEIEKTLKEDKREAKQDEDDDNEMEEEDDAA